MEFDNDQSLRFGSKDECIRRCESVDIDAYTRIISTTRGQYTMYSEVGARTHDNGE